jgi:hypothetical protein
VYTPPRPVGVLCSFSCVPPNPKPRPSPRRRDGPWRVAGESNGPGVAGCWTVFGCTLRPSSNVAQVWWRSCQRKSSNSVQRGRGLKFLFTILWASKGVPLREANTKPLSCHFPLHLNVWCELSARTLSGRCPQTRVGLPPDLEGKGTDSSCST